MLSWEYPPKNVGGLSTHVYNLSHELVNLGHEVHVITCEEGTAPIEENDKGVYVHRVSPYKIDTDDFTKWVMHLNFAMIEESIRLIKKLGKIDIIHAHDWLTAYSAKVLKWSYKIPMICTMHATEKGRNNGIRTDMQRYISSTEWMLNYEAWKVVVCSTYMKNEIVNTFSVPEDKVLIIPNGVNPKEFELEFDWISYRRKFAEDDEKIVFFIGRHVFEKGIQLLIDASYDIIQGYNKVKFVIAGKGPMTEELKSKVRNMGLADKFVFTGYMNNEGRDKLYKVSNVVVLPSLYEPFGIASIEAMACGCPVVVADTGGFSEIVEHKYNGMKMINGNANSLKDNVLNLLNDEGLCKYLSENALKTVSENYTWSKVADLTVKIYELVKEEAEGTEWGFGGEILSERASKPKRTRKGAKASTKTSKIEEKEEVSLAESKKSEAAAKKNATIPEKAKAKTKSKVEAQNEKTEKPKRVYKKRSTSAEAKSKTTETKPKTTRKRAVSNKKKEENEEKQESI